MYPLTKEFLNAQNDDGATALHLAIEAKSVKCLESLLSNDDVDATLSDENETTPVRAALLSSANKCAKILFETTASVVSEIKNTNLLLETAKTGNAEGVSIVMKAIPRTSLEGVLNNVDEEGFDVMAHCVMKNMSSCVQDLIKSGCVALKEWQNPDDGGNLLHLATQHGVCVKILDSLIGAGVQIRHEDCENLAPLHWAAKEGHRDLVNVLAPLSVDLRDSREGMTAVRCCFHLNISLQEFH